MIRLFYLLVYLTAIGLVGCNLFDDDSSLEQLARVNDVFLTKSDVSDILEKLDGEKDSATIISNYINNWIQQELLLQKAELNLTEEKKDFQKLLGDYRKSLIIYAYQQEWIRQTLDTNVSEEDISNYYNKNKWNFDLKENIVKTRYVVVPVNAPKLEGLEKDLRSNDEDSKSAFLDYCLQYAFDYNDNDTVWKTLNEVLRNIPLNVAINDDFLKQHQFVTSSDSLYIYMLQIEEYKLKDDTSPLEFEWEKIRNIIINQRKMSLLNEMKENLFKTSLQKGHAEIYQH